MAQVNKKDLEKLYRRLKKRSKTEVTAAMENVSRKAGFQVLRGAQDRVPVDQGLLRSSLSVGDQNNLFNFSLQGSRAEITVGSNLEYARYIEEGYTQKAGQFVPGYWRGDQFRYDPAAYEKYLSEKSAGNNPSLFDYGMVLTGKRIPGVRYLSKSREEVDSIMEELVKEELDDLARRLFPDG
ncbi:HK97 gp10 family phage protein [Brevibacillus sp. SIMBA_040]|uniref:HK97 gp10 family phage protein n=1 Tax=unclassified Brevibacillus TaxID=2684853 RepID=UPI00397DD60E